MTCDIHDLSADPGCGACQDAAEIRRLEREIVRAETPLKRELALALRRAAVAENLVAQMRELLADGVAMMEVDPECVPGTDSYMWTWAVRATLRAP